MEKSMQHITNMCYREGYPIEIQNSQDFGNYAVATRFIYEGEGLLRTIPYAAEVFDSYRKRMCAVCLLYQQRSSFTLHCHDCDQVYFCSPICQAVGMDPMVGGHAKICKALRRLASWNAERHTRSIVKLFLQILMAHWRERQGYATMYQSWKARHAAKELELELEKNRVELEALRGEIEKGVDQENADVHLALLTQKLQLRVITTDIDSSGGRSSPLSPGESSNCSALSSKEEEGEESEEISTVATEVETLRVNEIQEPIENLFVDVMRLQSHFQDWHEEDAQGWERQSRVVLSLLEMSGLEQWSRDGAPEGELATITEHDIKKTISALESNAFGMFDRSKAREVCFGRAIYPVASFFNHSCEMNALGVQADGSATESLGEDVVSYELEKREMPKFKKKLSAKAAKAAKVAAEKEAASPAGILAEEERARQAAVEQQTYDARLGEFRKMTFYAIKDVEPGDGITISYIDTSMPLQARRTALLTDYHFHCLCGRCVREEAKNAAQIAVTLAGKKEKGKKLK